MKKATSILLAIAMLMTLLPTIALAAPETQFQIEVTTESSLTQLKAGDTVTVKVKSPSTAISTFNLIDVGITFDKDKFSLISRKSTEIKAAYGNAFSEDIEFELYSQTMTSVANANNSGKVNIVTTNSNLSI
ncbi:MAG: hypothetical protein ACI4IW_08380 [Oscillospiraceae bacterium]